MKGFKMNILLKSMAVVSSLMAGLYAMEGDSEFNCNELGARNGNTMPDSVGHGDIANHLLLKNLLSERIPATIQFIKDDANQIPALELALNPYTSSLVNLALQLENMTLNTTCGSASTIGVDPGIIAREVLAAEAARLAAGVAAPDKELKFFSYWKKYDTLGSIHISSKPNNSRGKS